MFSKNFFLLFLLFYIPSVSYANVFSDLTCVKDIKTYYPSFVEGKLNWPKQKRFFRCIHDFLELIVEKNIFVHTSTRDHFTKEEIIRMFHLYFEYDLASSTSLTEKIFTIKKFFIGGSIDELKDKEIASFYKLIYDYQEIYFILHKQIPVLKKAFQEKPGSISPQEREKALDQMRKSFLLLAQAYRRENIVYRIDDFFQNEKHFRKARFIEASDELVVLEKAFLFLHNLFEGLFSPKQFIQGEDWPIALDSLYRSVSLFFYYKTYFLEDLSSSAFIYRTVEGVENLISSLKLVESQVTNKKTGFPLKNLDEMLSVVISFFQKDSHSFFSSSFNENIFANLNKDHAIPFFTRSINCFSLGMDSKEDCKSEWFVKSSVATFSFPDTKFEIFPDSIKRSQHSKSSTFMEVDKLKTIQKWLINYKKDISGMDSGQALSVATKRKFNHWLSPFFGWGKKARMEFGSLKRVDSLEKKYQLLNYQNFLPFFFDSYFPKDFFSFENRKEKPASIDFKTWQRIIDEMSPVFAVLVGGKGYKPSWREALLKLFYFSDSFLYSSNRDNLLNAGELVDLTIHFLEGVKNSQFTYEKLAHLCGKTLTKSCVAEKIIEDQEILAIFPRFQQVILNSYHKEKYKEKIRFFLEHQGESIQHLSFLSLFILIQTMEINFELIDRNQSFYLESDELLSFIQKIDDHFIGKIPFLLNTKQIQSYLMYSFKTGDIPFFTGASPSAPLKFNHWHLHFENQGQKSFKTSPSEFHFLMFDFYNLYQKL